MSLELKRNQVLSNFYCVSVPYCDLQYLLGRKTKTGFTCGVYGWNADIFIVDNWAIVTGYRPFENIKIDQKKKREIIKKYNEKWRTTNHFVFDKKEINEDIENFLKEIKKEVFKNEV